MSDRYAILPHVNALGAAAGAPWHVEGGDDQPYTRYVNAEGHCFRVGPHPNNRARLRVSGEYERSPQGHWVLYKSDPPTPVVSLAGDAKPTSLAKSIAGRFLPTFLALARLAAARAQGYRDGIAARVTTFHELETLGLPFRPFVGQQSYEVSFHEHTGGRYKTYCKIQVRDGGGVDIQIDNVPSALALEIGKLLVDAVQSEPTEEGTC